LTYVDEDKRHDADAKRRMRNCRRRKLKQHTGNILALCTNYLNH